MVDDIRLLFRWEPLLPLRLEWGTAVRQALGAVEIAGQVGEQETIGGPAALHLLSYPAVAHAEVKARNLVRNQFRRIHDLPTKLVLIACDYSDIPVSEADVEELLRAQTTNRIAERHAMRILEPEALTDLATAWLAACLSETGLLLRGRPVVDDARDAIADDLGIFL